jgi:hypothetical protein
MLAVHFVCSNLYQRLQNNKVAVIVW